MTEKMNNLLHRFETYFLDKGIRDISLSQSFDEIPTLKLQVWIQHYLNELGIVEASFKMIDGKMFVNQYKYKSFFGETSHQSLYDIILHDDTGEFLPDNIKAVVFNHLI